MRKNDTEVLLARRVGEADYDQTYAFIGGKMEITDKDIIEGLRREKTEEIGTKAKVSICPYVSYNIPYVKKSGQHMILPHYYANYLGGEITLNEEYDDFQWVPLTRLEKFSPRIENIPEMIPWVLKLKTALKPTDFIVI